MRGRSVTFVVALIVISVVFLTCFTKQRKALAAIRDRISVAEIDADNLPKEERPVLSATGRRSKKKPVVESDVDLSLVPPKKERVAFLKEMRSLIRHSDSGMTSFIPSKEYSRKIHSMNAETLKVLLSDLENFQTNWINTSVMKDKLLGSLVHLDPAFVLDAAHGGGNEKWGGPMMTAIRMIARSNPDAAIGWIEGSTWEDAEWKYKLTSIYAQVIAKEDLPLALETIGQFQKYVDEFNDALRRVAITAETPEQRRQIAGYLHGVEDPEIREDIRATLVRGVFFREGFASTTEAMAELFEKGKSHVRNDLIGEIAVEALPEGRGSEIAGWVLRASTDDERISNLKILVRDWVKRDHNAAAAWIGEMAEGVERNTAIIVLADQVRQFDPEGAAAWELEIR